MKRTRNASHLACLGATLLVTPAIAQQIVESSLASSDDPVASSSIVDASDLRGADGEDFESFAISSLLGQNGWFPIFTGAFIQDRSAISSAFGNRTLVLPSAGLTVPYGAERRFGSAQSMRIDADFVVTGQFASRTTEGASIDVSNTGVMTFNTRVVLRCHESNASGGDILVLQALAPDRGVLMDTGVDWATGQVLRLGVEVLANWGVHVYVNDEHVFAGHDIAAFIGASDAGTNRVAFRLSGGLAEVAVDNVSHVEVIASDFTRNGVVDSKDLAEVLRHWGADTARIDLDQNGVIDGADLAIVLAEWSR
jgi:hypothetical protein